VRLTPCGIRSLIRSPYTFLTQSDPKIALSGHTAEAEEMKKAKIVLLGEPVLREKSKEVSVFHKKLHDIVDTMKFTLQERGDGAAVAANQIAVAKRIVVIDFLGEYLEMINPEITASSGIQTDYEGCLSVPGFSGIVTRAETVTVTYKNRFGSETTIERSGSMARCIQHELDHLDGILYIDRLDEDRVYDNETETPVLLSDLIAHSDQYFS